MAFRAICSLIIFISMFAPFHNIFPQFLHKAVCNMNTTYRVNSMSVQKTSTYQDENLLFGFDCVLYCTKFIAIKVVSTKFYGCLPILKQI